MNKTDELNHIQLIDMGKYMASYEKQLSEKILHTFAAIVACCPTNISSWFVKTHYKHAAQTLEGEKKDEKMCVHFG